MYRELLQKLRDVGQPKLNSKLINKPVYFWNPDRPVTPVTLRSINGYPTTEISGACVATFLENVHKSDVIILASGSSYGLESLFFVLGRWNVDANAIDVAGKSAAVFTIWYLSSNAFIDPLVTSIRDPDLFIDKIFQEIIAGRIRRV